MLKEITKKSIIGILAGFVSGFFSTGGGMILVPAFVYILGMSAKKSRGTSIFCILPMVITSSIFYYKGNYINWKIAILCAIGRKHRRLYWSKIIKKITRKSFKNSFYCFFSVCIFQNANNINKKKGKKDVGNNNRINIRNN